MRGTSDITGTNPASPVIAVTRVQPVGDPGRDALARFARIELGTRLDALLTSRHADGSFNVELADTVLRMNFPAGSRVGDRLKLTLLASEPRPAFLLRQDTGAASASLSAAGRLIDALLAQPAGRQQPQAVLNARLPVLPAAVQNAPALANALQTALRQSGLFYESHLAQWANGIGSVEQLRQQPQARFGQAQLQAPASNAGADNATGAGPAGSRAIAGNAAGPHAHPAQLAGDEPTLSAASLQAPARLMSGAGPGMPAAPAAPANPVPPIDEMQAAAPDGSLQHPADGEQLAIDPNGEAAHMIRLQLDTLEHRQLLWRGEAWPGMPMEWGVAQGQAEHNAGSDQTAWQSVLRFHLPLLGKVAATIRLENNQLQLAMRTDSQAVAQRLRDQSGALADALDAAGTPLTLLSIREQDQS